MGAFWACALRRIARKISPVRQKFLKSTFSAGRMPGNQADPLQPDPAAEFPNRESAQSQGNDQKREYHQRNQQPDNIENQERLFGTPSRKHRGDQPEDGKNRRHNAAASAKQKMNRQRNDSKHQTRDPEFVRSSRTDCRSRLAVLDRCMPGVFAGDWRLRIIRLRCSESLSRSGRTLRRGGAITRKRLPLMRAAVGIVSGGVFRDRNLVDGSANGASGRAPGVNRIQTQN